MTESKGLRVSDALLVGFAAGVSVLGLLQALTEPDTPQVEIGSTIAALRCAEDEAIVVNVLRDGSATWFCESR